jgi:hypothetical protein
MVEFHRPIEMHSVSMAHPDEIEEFRRRCPGVEVSSDPTDDLYGVPIARTRREKLAVLDAVGFEEKN